MRSVVRDLHVDKRGVVMDIGNNHMAAIAAVGTTSIRHMRGDKGDGTPAALHSFEASQTADWLLEKKRRNNIKVRCKKQKSDKAIKL